MCKGLIVQVGGVKIVPYSDLAPDNIVLGKEDTWEMDTAQYTTYYSFLGDISELVHQV